jgi:MFS family permease
LVSAIGPIYLYRIGFSLKSIIVFFILTAIFKVASLPLVFRLVSKIGVNPIIIFGIVTMAAHLLIYSTITRNSSLVLLAATLGIANASFFPVFRIAFSLALSADKAASQSALLNTLSLVFSALMPIIGGIIATFFSPRLAYTLPFFIMLFALIPILNYPNAKPERIRFSRKYSKTAWREYRANASYSFSGLADMLVWPIFLSMLIPTYAGLGILAGVVILISAGIQIVVGKLCDRQDESYYLFAGTLLVTGYNFTRVFVLTIPQVIGLSAISAVGSSVIASAYGGRFYKNIDTSCRLDYLFGAEMANSIPWLIYFPILLVVSYYFSVPETLKFGTLIIAAATLSMNLKRRTPIPQAQRRLIQTQV